MDHYNDSDIDFSDIDFDLAYTDIDCLICGHSIGYVDGLSHNPLLSGKRGLKASKPLACFPEKGSKRVAYCSAAKLEEMDLGEDGTRICLYRLIIVEPDEKQHYLSGIAQMEGWLRQEFVVPKDRNEAVVGQPRKDKKGMLYIPPASYLQFRPNRPSGCRGYPLHSRCWSFIERFIGEEVEKHLALLLRVLQGRYREIHCGGLDPAIEGNCRCWREFFEKDSEEDPVDEDPLYDSPIDPLHALTIQKIIRESKSRAIKNESLESEQIHSKVPLCVMTRLPPEIQYMFLDLLDYKDISKVRKAVRWPTDDAYWCTRAPRTILFELQDVPKDSSVDWEYLCLQAEKLLEEQAGKLLNRQRLLKHVEDITEIFRKELMAERKRTPSTNGV